MKLLLAPDKFKHALSAAGACKAMEQGVALLDKQITVTSLPLADGGEGTAAALTYFHQGEFREVTVSDPLMRPIQASFGLSRDHKTAFIEMARASGLELLSPAERNACRTTSFGTGELIKAAIAAGVDSIILGVGGSATCDGGLGMAAALGYRFFDDKGQQTGLAGQHLNTIHTIDTTHVLPELQHISIRVACDVRNVLTGAEGAAHMFAPQKGADAREVSTLDTGLQHWADLISKALDVNIGEIPYAGAAGGLAGGARACLGASLHSGIDLVMEEVQFYRHLPYVDLLITGEGKLDAQSGFGKVIQGVSAAAGRQGIPVAALCGCLKAGPQYTKALGLCYAASILKQPCTLEEALAQTPGNLTEASYQLVSLFNS